MRAMIRARAVCLHLCGKFYRFGEATSSFSKMYWPGAGPVPASSTAFSGQKPAQAETARRRYWPCLSSESGGIQRRFFSRPNAPSAWMERKMRRQLCTHCCGYGQSSRRLQFTLRSGELRCRAFPPDERTLKQKGRLDNPFAGCAVCLFYLLLLQRVL